MGVSGAVMQYLLLQATNNLHATLLLQLHNALDVSCPTSPPWSQRRHEMIIIAVEWVYLWGLQWIILIERKQSKGLNEAYKSKNLMLIGGLLSALSTVPTGFLEEGMSGLQAKGPNLLPKCQKSPGANQNLGHPRAYQGTCNKGIDKQSDMHAHRHIQAL